MKFAIAVVFCVALQQHIPSTFSVSQCSTVQYVGGPKYAPINLDTSYATEVKTASPLTFTVGDWEQFKVKNTGSSVEITLNQPTSINSVTGGILWNNVYAFGKIRYFWTHDFNGHASYTVDRTPWPLTGEYIYYKKSYGSLENAYTQPQGIVVVRSQIAVEGAIANPQFTKFENVLKNITKAGSSSEVRGNVRETIYGFFDQIAIDYPFYYSYVGTYYDQSQNNSTICYSATYILIPKSRTGYLSVCQFTAFTDLENYVGKPIANVQDAYPSRGRAISQAAGIKEIVYYTPFEKNKTN